MKKTIGIILATLALLVIGCLVFFQHFFFYEVYGTSMSPTLKNGESVLSREFALKDIEQGDIIGFEHPLLADGDYLKRVVALPGDTVEVKAQQVLVNGKKTTYPINPKGAPDFGPVKVEKDHLFVLGDQMADSDDSRTLGTVSYKQIRGVLVFR